MQLTSTTTVKSSTESTDNGDCSAREELKENGHNLTMEADGDSILENGNGEIKSVTKGNIMEQTPEQKPGLGEDNFATSNGTTTFKLETNDTSFLSSFQSIDNSVESDENGTSGVSGEPDGSMKIDSKNTDNSEEKKMECEQSVDQSAKESDLQNCAEQEEIKLINIDKTVSSDTPQAEDLENTNDTANDKTLTTELNSCSDLEQVETSLPTAELTSKDAQENTKKIEAASDLKDSLTHKDGELTTTERLPRGEGNENIDNTEPERRKTYGKSPINTTPASAEANSCEGSVSRTVVDGESVKPVPTGSHSASLASSTQDVDNTAGDVLKLVDDSEVAETKSENAESSKDSGSDSKNVTNNSLTQPSSQPVVTSFPASANNQQPSTSSADKVTAGTSKDTVDVRGPGPEVITVTMDRNSKVVKDIGTSKPITVKTCFNIQPPVGNMASGSRPQAPCAQDIKDGHAYLRPMPKFLYQLGLSLLREIVYDGLSQHVGGLRKKGDKKYSEEQYTSLQNSLSNLRKDNKHLRSPFDKVCPANIDGTPCGFRTESDLALETHLSQAHVSRSHRYACARCELFFTPHANQFKHHMLDKHGWLATVTKKVEFYQCKLCQYDTPHQSRIESHMSACAKTFHLSSNLRPDGLSNTPLDEGIYRTVKLTAPAPPPLVSKAAPVVPTMAALLAKPIVSQPKTKLGPTYLQQSGVGTGTLQQIKIHPAATVVSNVAATKPTHQPIAPTPPISTAVTQIGGKPVMAEVMQCEICGGYIQGTQALKVHMQWCHSVNITHLRFPAFSCPNDHCCHQRFWTVQGLAKHTTTCVATRYVLIPGESCCFLCCRPYHTSQVEHLLAKHLNDLKKMVEAKKCLAPKCLQYRFLSVDNLQAHLAQEHRLKMTGLQGLAAANVGNIKFQPFCSICKLKFSSSAEFAQHCAETHVHKCDLCGAQCSTLNGLKEHENIAHPLRFCLLCEKSVKRTHYLKHAVAFHRTNQCKVNLKRMSQNEYETYNKKPKLENWS